MPPPSSSFVEAPTGGAPQRNARPIYPDGITSADTRAAFDRLLLWLKRPPTVLELRGELCITQAQMARIVGCCVRSYHSWEHQSCSPRMYRRRPLMEALGVPFEHHRAVFGEFGLGGKVGRPFKVKAGVDAGEA